MILQSYHHKYQDKFIYKLSIYYYCYIYCRNTIKSLIFVVFIPRKKIANTYVSAILNSNVYGKYS